MLLFRSPHFDRSSTTSVQAIGAAIGVQQVIAYTLHHHSLLTHAYTVASAKTPQVKS